MTDNNQKDTPGQDATYDTFYSARKTAWAHRSPDQHRRDVAEKDVETMRKAAEMPGGTGAKARRFLSHFQRTIQSMERLEDLLPPAFRKGK